METQKNNFLIKPKKINKLSKTLSRFSTLDPKLTQQLAQRKQILMAIKNAESLNPSIDFSHSNDSSKGIQKKELTRERSISSQVKTKQVLKSIQKENKSRNSSVDAKSLSKSRLSFNSPFIKKENILQQSNKLSLQLKDPAQKRQLRILEMLKPSKRQNADKIRILSQDSKNQNFEQNRDQKNRKSYLNQYNQLENEEKSLYLKLKQNANLQTSNERKFFSCQIDENLKKNQLLKLRKLTIFSGLTSISILPKNLQYQTKEISVIDEGVQAVKAEPQFFEYIIYKKKKDQFEVELQKLFNDLEIIKQDQKKCHERGVKIGHIYAEPPTNQIEERIFELKNQIEFFHKKMMAEMYKKEKQSSTILQKLNQIESTLVAGLKKIDSMSKSYLKQFREIFEKHGQQKHARTTERIQILYSNLIKEIHSNIKKEVQKFCREMQETKQLKQCLTDYMKCLKEEKNLLRSCFHHIKYLPELSYKLFGDELNQNQQKEILDVLGHVIKQKEIPKCLRCYHSARKMSLIVQKNILMRSILKITDQLVN